MRLNVLVVFFMLLSCGKEEEAIMFSNDLLSYTLSNVTENGAVIACAASDENTNSTLVFYYATVGASDIRLYETETVQDDKNDFSKYEQVSLASEPVFNGYMGRFLRDINTEKWIIITYEHNGIIKVSNPIRTKQIAKPTVWNDDITINQDSLLMPEFTWQDNAFGENAIYFQVVSKENNDLVSGTYTYDNTFMFYNTSNVVLNITNGIPLLENESIYNFTLMDVSTDNWVNLISQKSFTTP